MLFDAAKILQLFDICKSFMYFLKKILIISIFMLRLCTFVITPSKKITQGTIRIAFSPNYRHFSTAIVHLSPADYPRIDYRWVLKIPT